MRSRGSATIRTPFATSLLAHCLSWRALREHGDARARTSPMWAHWTDGIWPDLRDLAARVLVEDQVRPHSHLAALHSSMAFGLNLFLPFRAGADLAPALAPIVGPLIVDRVVFEWIPPGHILGELDGDLPRDDEPATSIDVVVHGRRTDGTRVTLLIEVKLSEGGFSCCNGRHSRANRRRDVCEDAATFLADPSACYLQRPVRKRRDRRYWHIFAQQHGSVEAAFPGIQAGPCPFADDAQQPMRQYALALGLEQAGITDEAYLLLVHHDDNPDVPRAWAAWTALTHPDARIARLPASHLLHSSRPPHLDGWARYIADRYRLELP